MKNKTVLKNVFVAISGCVAGAVFYFGNLHRLGKPVGYSDISIPVAVVFSLAACVLTTFLWVLTSASMTKIFRTGLEEELGVQSYFYMLPLCLVPVLPFFKIYYPKLSQVVFDVVGYVYYPFKGYMQYNFAGYLLVTMLGFCFCLTCFLLFIRFCILLSTLSGKIPALFFGAVFAFYSAMSIYLVFVYPPTGDETHHLLIAKSLSDDRDIDLQNDFITARTYEKFYPVYLTPGDEHNISGPCGKGLYSKHGAGLPFILAPVFKVAGRYGTAIFMCLLSAVFFAVFLNYLLRLGAVVKYAVTGASLLSLTVPFCINSALILSEIPAALVIIYCLFFLSGKPEEEYADRNKATLYFLGIAFLPWLHPKLAVFSVVLSAAYWVTGARASALKLKNEVLNIAIAAVSAALYASVQAMMTGKGLFGAVTSAAISKSYFFIFDPKFSAKAFMAIMFDRNFGLITNNLLFIVAAWGVMHAVAGKCNRVVFSLLLSLPYALVFLFWSDWSGSMTPARQLIPVLPSVAAAGTLFAQEKDLLRSRTVTFFAGVSVLIAYIYMSFPALRYAGAKEKIVDALSSLKINLTWFLPYFHDKIGFSHYLTVFYLAAIVASYFMFNRKEGR